MKGVQIMITPSFPDTKNTRRKSTDRNRTKNSINSRNRSKNFEQKVKNDVKVALNDQVMSREIISQMDDIVMKRKMEGKRPNDKDIVQLNIKAMGVWNEFEKQKLKH